MKNRGMLLEMLINKTIVFYEENDLALFHKKNIDFKFRKISKNENKLETNKAWITSKSTVDYYGLYEGVFVAFEAKSTHEDKIPIKNIKDHQRNYIKKVLFLKGIGFYIFGFINFNKFFLVTEKVVSKAKKKHLSIDDLAKKGIQIPLIYPGVLDFLPSLKKIIKNNF